MEAEVEARKRVARRHEEERARLLRAVAVQAIPSIRSILSVALSWKSLEQRRIEIGQFLR
jgi:hypothetical protein